ncbi:MAG: hypothetical protein IJT65_01390 [Eubacterium sp.]|nr:hypothetical protein [Eubacterium sp.]
MIVTNVISIIVSGFISWLITFLYFKKTNRNAALANVLEPFAVALEGNPVDETLYELMEIQEKYEYLFLSKKERIAINNCVTSLSELVSNTDMSIDSVILKKHFFKTLEKYGYSLYEDNNEYIFINDNGEQELSLYYYGDIEESILNLFKANDDKYYCIESQNSAQVYLEKEINKIFNDYAQRYLDKPFDVNFFEGTDIITVLDNDELTDKHSNLNDAFYANKDNFYKTCKRLLDNYDKIYLGI